MTSSGLDVVAIGDAIVDVIATCEDSFIVERGLTKGSMRLLSTEEADDLYAAMGPAREVSGGSAANSMAGLAALGLRAGFVGQVASDQLGEIFAHDMTSLGVTFETPRLSGGPPTGRCLILVTPDAQRTMNTSPGASHELTAEALDEDQIRSAMLRAAEIARAAGRTVAFTLSESLCIAGRREGVLGMIERGTVDILFANEDEVRHLTGLDDLGECLAELSGKIPTLVVTRGAAGALAIEGGERVDVAAAPVAKVVDTTGAGDLFAAGFLAARCRGAPIRRCLDAGSLAAAEVISHFGARPEADLRALVRL